MTNAKIASSASIGLDKLASGTDAQIPICSATGVATYQTLTGATLTNTGAFSFSLGTDSVTTDNIVDDNVTDAKILSKKTVSTSAPSGGADGDVWYKVAS